MTTSVTQATQTTHTASTPVENPLTPAAAAAAAQAQKITVLPLTKANLANYDVEVMDATPSEIDHGMVNTVPYPEKTPSELGKQLVPISDVDHGGIPTITTLPTLPETLAERTARIITPALQAKIGAGLTITSIVGLILAAAGVYSIPVIGLIALVATAALGLIAISHATFRKSPEQNEQAAPSAPMKIVDQSEEIGIESEIGDEEIREKTITTDAYEEAQKGTLLGRIKSTLSADKPSVAETQPAAIEMQPLTIANKSEEPDLAMFDSTALESMNSKKPTQTKVAEPNQEQAIPKERKVVTPENYMLNFQEEMVRRNREMCKPSAPKTAVQTQPSNLSTVANSVKTIGNRIAKVGLAGMFVLSYAVPITIIRAVLNKS